MKQCVSCDGPKTNSYQTEPVQSEATGPLELVTLLIYMYKEDPLLAIPLRNNCHFYKEGNKYVTKRISSALALIFVFSLGQFVLALNTTAPTVATPTLAQDQNRP